MSEEEVIVFEKSRGPDIRGVLRKLHFRWDD